jgi:hypothetical protein
MEQTFEKLIVDQLVIPRNLQVYHHMHKSTPPVPILGQVNQVHTLPIFLRLILVLPFHLRLDFLSGFLPFRLSNQHFVAFLVVPTRAICSVHLILLDYLITIIILSNEYNLRSFLQPPVVLSSLISK